MSDKAFYRAPVWYPVLGEYTLLTTFIKLAPEEIALLAAGSGRGKEVRGVIGRLRRAMRGGMFDDFFLSTDCCSPTDTERFYAKRGAVHSAESGWFYLAKSVKTQRAAQEGRVEYLSVKPFVSMDRTREFRLFVCDGELKAMSQYNLIRHFRRLEGIRKPLWQCAQQWFESVKWRIPVRELVIDVHVTADFQIEVVDLNGWGGTTSPLLLNRWDRDWDPVTGLVLMPPPTRISGDVAVSF